MTAPLLVRAYEDSGQANPRSRPIGVQTLPPIASFTFAEILRSADGPEVQSAIDGIAEICAKNKMSLADEYASHLPPLGEITAASSTASRPHLHRPGPRRALTSVPEASSSSSEGSGRSKKRKGSLFFFRPQRVEPNRQSRTMRIGSTGRTVLITSTTSVSTNVQDMPSQNITRSLGDHKTVSAAAVEPGQDRRSSDAAASLQDVLARSYRTGVSGD